MPKLPQKRNIADKNKSIRRNPPRVAKSIDQLIDRYLNSDDHKLFRRRFTKR